MDLRMYKNCLINQNFTTTLQYILGPLGVMDPCLNFPKIDAILVSVKSFGSIFI